MHSRRPHEDDDVFPFGKYRESGTLMKDVPVEYLAFLSEQRWIIDWPRLAGYLHQHKDRVDEAKKKVREDKPEPEGFGSLEDCLKDIRGY